MDGIDLDEVSGGINPISLGLAHGVTRLPAPLPGLSGKTDIFSDDAEKAFITGVLRLRKSRNRTATVHLQSPSLLSKEWWEVHGSLPAPRGSQAYLFPTGDTCDEGLRCDPGRLKAFAGMMGTMALILEGREIIGVESAFPTVEVLRRYIEMAAGQSRIPVLGVMVHPL